MVMVMDENVSIERLVEQGFEKVGCFAGDYIMRKGDERVLYDPVREEVWFKYDFVREYVGGKK
jgi:hypothetical protein